MKSGLPRSLLDARRGPWNAIIPGNSGSSSLCGVSSSTYRVRSARAGRPVNALVTCLRSSFAWAKVLRYASGMAVSGQRKNAVPICTALAPSACAAATPRPSAIPPAAMTDTDTASTTWGRERTYRSARARTAKRMCPGGRPPPIPAPRSDQRPDLRVVVSRERWSPCSRSCFRRL